MQMIDDTVGGPIDNERASRWDYFTRYYTTLDSFGFYRDRKFENMIDDATHSFYGAHCDMFVTDDKNAFHKTKAIYEKLNISTHVCETRDFISTYYSFVELPSFGSNSILDQVSDIIKTGIVLLKTCDDELNPAWVFKVRYPLIDFFNRMQITYLANETSLLFYKKIDNYSDFMFWTEIKFIVNKIVSYFGIDDNLKMEFAQEEELEISNKSWQGRIWKSGLLTVKIFYYYDYNGIVLRMNYAKK